MASFSLDSDNVAAQGAQFANLVAGCQVNTVDGRLLGTIAWLLLKLLQQISFGTSYSRVRAVNISPTPSKIVDIDINGHVRKIDLWIDTNTGGPQPSVRVSDSSAVTPTGGGALMVPGQGNPLGEVHPNSILYAVSNVPVMGYILERA